MSNPSALRVPSSPEELEGFVNLFSLNIIPLRVVLASMTWVVCDYFSTLEDEVRYIWTQKKSVARTMYLFIRYYTVFLLIFDVLQIHTFAIPGVASNTMCVAMDPITRMLGATMLWAIEIVMQIRVYALYNRSRKVAIFNGVLFVVSVVSFIWIMVHNALKRSELIASAVRLPLPGCPSINAGIQWAQWLPATGFELVLFGFVLFRASKSVVLTVQSMSKHSVMRALIGENVAYFFVVSCLLVFNNLMVVGATKIPWFSFGPFHAALGIMTSHMLMHLRKTAARADGEFLSGSAGQESYLSGPPKFASGGGGSFESDPPISICTTNGKGLEHSNSNSGSDYGNCEEMSEEGVCSSRGKSAALFGVPSGSQSKRRSEDIEGQLSASHYRRVNVCVNVDAEVR